MIDAEIHEKKSLSPLSQKQCPNRECPRLYFVIKALVHFKFKLNSVWYCLTLSRQLLFLEMVMSFATYSLLLSM